MNYGPPSLSCKGVGVFQSVFGVSGVIDSLSTSSGQVGKDIRATGRTSHAKVLTRVGSIANQISGAQSVFKTFLNYVDDSVDNLAKISTVMPKTSAYASENFYLPENTWQAITDEADAKYWKEMIIRNSFGISMPYPGYDTWSNGKAVKAYENGRVAEKSLYTEYIINTAMEKTGV